MTSPGRSSRPELATLRIPGPPEPWERLGLAKPPFTFGAERLTLALTGLDEGADVDGLPLERADEPLARELTIDHVVAHTGDFARTRDKLVAAGFDHRRDRDAGNGRSQAFFVLGACLLELVGPVEAGPPSLWGVTLIVDDLAAYAEHTGAIKDAVQAGRRIATVRKEAGLGVPLALMTPRH
jgi:hypothetical protein